MNTETIAKETALLKQQASLLDKLTVQLEQVQAELGIKNLTICEQEAARIVSEHVLTGSAMGLAPLPLFDLVALTGVQHNMLEQLCLHYGVEFDRHKIRAALIAVLGGVTPTLALVGLGSAFKFMPGVGTLAGNASLTVLGGAVTYAVGQSFIAHFAAGGTLDDINAVKLGRFFRKALSQKKQPMSV